MKQSITTMMMPHTKHAAGRCFRTLALVLLVSSGCTYYHGATSNNGKLYLTYSRGWLFYSNGVMECRQQGGELNCTDLEMNTGLDPSDLRTTPDGSRFQSQPLVPRRTETQQPVTQPKSAVSPKANAAPGSTVELGSMEALGNASILLATWVGQDVTVELKDGSKVNGTMTGVSGSTMILQTKEGRWSGDMLDAIRATTR